MLTPDTPMNVCFPSRHLCQFSHALNPSLFLPFRLIFCIRSSPCAVQTNIIWRMKDQLDVTCYFISLLTCSACFGQAVACKTNTTQNQPSSNTQRTENKMTDVVIQQHSRKLLMMDILMSETCWAHKKWNKIASDIKLVFLSSTITMMHGTINIRFTT